uniref:Uncharacterized protein n=1 Tax=Polytomella parva TaxID=51329 RepID=A0A7S0YMG2_9CHLO|mmetsp:Transcript_28554/g.52533  ORF Transcript_28554/g.52533 Transcript_28554/m.52533 type:complete len:203 (+) Transcript_28554:79-687(+)
MGFMDKLSAPKFSGRHSRSAGRSRRDEVSSNGARDSYDSAAGNLSPGRMNNKGRGESHRPEHGFSFLKKKSPERSPSPAPLPPSNPQMNQDHYHYNHDEDRSRSPSFKLRNLFGRSNSKDNVSSQLPASPPPSQQLVQRDFHHEIQVLETQLHDYENLKKRLKAEEKQCAEWREKWNYQNFKLNLMADMLVLRVLEVERIVE